MPPARIILPRKSLLKPDLAAVWLSEIAESFGGQPAWSADNMRRLLSAADDVAAPLAFSLAQEATVDEDTGLFRLVVAQPFRPSLSITYDQRKQIWETADAIGFGPDGLLAKCQRPYSRHHDLHSLEGATCLAACLGLAVLAVAERQTKAGG